MACAARRATKVHEFVAHGAVVNCISIGRKSGKVVATAGDDKKINLWTIPRYNCVLRLHGHTTPIDTVKFHPNEDLLASGSNSGAVKLFDLEAARVLRTLNGHKASVQCIDFHPYGEFIASGSCDNSIKLWDSRRRSCINTYRGHEQKVNSIRFSPDGRWIVSGGDDGSIKLWDLAMGKMLTQFNEHQAPVSDVEFHPNEYLLASGSEDGSVKFYDLETWNLISSTSGDSGQVHCTRFHPDGDVIMVGADDLMRVYGWEPTVNTFDRVVMGWGRVEDLMVGKEAIVAASKSVTNVCVYVLDTNKVQPFAGSTTFIDEVPMKTTSFRRSSPLGSNPRRSFNTKTRGKLDVAYKREINSSEASDNSYDSYEPSSTDDVCIMEPSSYNEIFHPSKELSRGPPRDSYPVMSNSGSGLFRLPPIKDAAPSLTTATTTPVGPSRSPPRVDPVISRNLQSSECLKSITAGNRISVNSTSTTTAMNNFNNTVNTNNTSNKTNNAYTTSNMRSSYSMGNIKETTQHHGSLSSSSSTLSSVSDNNRKTGTANSTSSGDLSPILPVSEPSTPVKTQNFLPRRGAEKTSSEQSLVSIVKPVMSVKAAAVVHPEVVTNIPPAVCQPEKQGYNTESLSGNGTCGGGGGNGGGGGGGGALNFDDFLPAHVQSLSRGPRSTVPVSETEAIEKISAGHNGMMVAMMHRLNGLRQIHARWNPKDPRSAVEVALNLRDASVLVDLLNVLVLRSAMWNLDLCHLLLPAMYELIQSKYEPQMATAISGIKLVLKNFGTIIKDTVAGPRSVGVDLSREERYGKCSGCHESLMTIRSFLLKRQTMQGKVGSQFRDLLAVMEMLD